MKWNEMSTVRKILFVTGWICGIVYLILDILIITNVIVTTADHLRVLKAIWLFSFGVWIKNISNGWHVIFYALAVWELFDFVMSFVAL